MPVKAIKIKAAPPQQTTDKGFFRLPPEVRNCIYEACLVEEPKWMKRHEWSCQFSAPLHEMERPPFIDSAVLPCDFDEHKPQCRCARRKGLGLLRASRLVYAEAAPIFYARNTFFFAHPRQFIREVGGVGVGVGAGGLRPAYRARLQSIAVMGYANEAAYHDFDNSWHYKRYRDALWTTLAQCVGLRRLELSLRLVADAHFRSFADLLAALPHLTCLSVSVLLGFSLWPSENTDSDHPQDERPPRVTLFRGVYGGSNKNLASRLWCRVGAAETLDRAAIWANLARARDAQETFVAHVREDVVEQLVQAIQAAAWDWGRADATTRCVRPALQGEEEEEEDNNAATRAHLHGYEYYVPGHMTLRPLPAPPRRVATIGRRVDLRDGPLRVRLLLSLRSGRRRALSVLFMGLPVSRATNVARNVSSEAARSHAAAQAAAALRHRQRHDNAAAEAARLYEEAVALRAARRAEKDDTTERASSTSTQRKQQVIARSQRKLEATRQAERRRSTELQRPKELRQAAERAAIETARQEKKAAWQQQKKLDKEKKKVAQSQPAAKSSGGGVRATKNLAGYDSDDLVCADDAEYDEDDYEEDYDDVKERESR